MKMNLKTRKMLDVQWGNPEMPDDIKEFFFDQCGVTSNDVWVEYTIGDADGEIDCDICEYNEAGECPYECPSYTNDNKNNILDDWLLANTDAKDGETLFLKHWW